MVALGRSVCEDTEPRGFNDRTEKQWVECLARKYVAKKHGGIDANFLSCEYLLPIELTLKTHLQCLVCSKVAGTRLVAGYSSPRESKTIPQNRLQNTKMLLLPH